MVLPELTQRFLDGTLDPDHREAVHEWIEEHVEDWLEENEEGE